MAKQMTENEKIDRQKMVLAMEFICRQLNDEEDLFGWLMNGVADGDIEYGEFDPSKVRELDWYIQDDNFRELMDCFLRRMSSAKKEGGLYCGGVVTTEG